MNEEDTRVRLRRAPLFDSPGGAAFDVTARSCRGWACAFAPDWNLIMSLRKGEIERPEFSMKYALGVQANIEADPTGVNMVYNTGWRYNRVATFLCYCKDQVFCHTHVLIDTLVLLFPGHFADGRQSWEMLF